MSLYKHFTIDEREQIFLLFHQGHSIRGIAKTLERSPSTISRELARNQENKIIHLQLHNQNTQKENQIVAESSF